MPGFCDLKKLICEYRLELSRRLTELTLYHNQSLALSIEQLRRDLPDARVLLVDSFALFGSLYGDSPFDYGYEYAADEEVLEFGDRELRLQGPCYSGAYLGTRDPDNICEAPERVLFWDVVHPTSLTHCWQAWGIGNALHMTGWLGALPAPQEYLHWCRSVVERITFGADSWYIVDDGPTGH
jgi:phospholipase/lecithinase/hemolysin